MKTGKQNKSATNPSNPVLAAESRRVKDQSSGGSTAQQTYVFTSESVCEGHPDKVCDLIADTILDDYIFRIRTAALPVKCFANWAPSFSPAKLLQKPPSTTKA